MTHAHIPIFYNLPKKSPYQGAKGFSSSSEHPFLPLRILRVPSNRSLSQYVSLTLSLLAYPASEG